jgi:hypothetical protein
VAGGKFSSEAKDNLLFFFLFFHLAARQIWGENVGWGRGKKKNALSMGKTTASPFHPKAVFGARDNYPLLRHDRGREVLFICPASHLLAVGM